MTEQAKEKERDRFKHWVVNVCGGSKLTFMSEIAESNGKDDVRGQTTILTGL